MGGLGWKYRIGSFSTRWFIWSQLQVIFRIDYSSKMPINFISPLLLLSPNNIYIIKGQRGFENGAQFVGQRTGYEFRYALWFWWWWRRSASAHVGSYDTFNGENIVVKILPTFKSKFWLKFESQDVDGCPKLQNSTPDKFFAKLESQGSQLCRWIGELYLEVRRLSFFDHRVLQKWTFKFFLSCL